MPLRVTACGLELELRTTDLDTARVNMKVRVSVGVRVSVRVKVHVTITVHLTITLAPTRPATETTVAAKGSLYSHSPHYGLFIALW